MAARRGTARARLERRADNRGWIYALFAILFMMVVVTAWRAWEDSRPTEVRFGARRYEGVREADVVVANLAQMPEMANDRGVAIVRQGATEVFVVRIDENNYRVWGLRSVRGKPLRWDPKSGYLVYARDSSVYFDIASGAVKKQGVEDQLRSHVSRHVGNRLEINP